MQKQYDKERKRTKITIKDEDLAAWGIESLSENDIKNWIKIGIKNEGIYKKIASLEDKLERFIKMSGFFLHHIYMKTGQISHDENVTRDDLYDESLWKELNISFKVRDHFFPDFKIRSYEHELEAWLKKDTKC